MNHTYKIGDSVVIVGNSNPLPYGLHHYAIGTTCKILGKDTEERGFYQLYGAPKSFDDSAWQHVHVSDFRPADTSYSLKEYRDRELLPLVDDEQPSDIAHGI